MASPLTDKQARFIEEYLVDLNATQAAIRAGYAPKDADVQGPRLLGNVGVATAIAVAKAERSRRIGLTADRVIEELAVVAFARMGEYVTWGPNGVTLVDSDTVDTRAVAEVRETVTQHGGSTGIKLHDKIAALTKLGQHLGILTEKHEVKGQVDHVVTIETIRKAIGIAS